MLPVIKNIINKFIGARADIGAVAYVQYYGASTAYTCTYVLLVVFSTA